MFLFRFVFFCLKLLSCCVFVMILQIRVGDNKMESLLEEQLKKSSITRYLEKASFSNYVQEFVQESLLGQANPQNEKSITKTEASREKSKTRQGG